MRPRPRPYPTLVTAILLALIGAACAGADDDSSESADTTDADTGEAAAAGLAGCVDDPVGCNAGERADGGSMTWVLNTQPASWSSWSSEGGSVYTLQMLHGVFPHTGGWAPDGNYQFNMDLLAAEPELLGEDPFQYQFEIRDEAVWDDDTPITADDFIVSWKLGTSEDKGHCVGCRPRFTARYDKIATMEGSADGKVVTVTLEEGESDPEWFGLFSVEDIGGGFVPAHVAEDNGFDVDDPEQLGEYFEYLNETMPTFSGGPYVLVEGDFENQVIKEPNLNWYGEDQPTLDTLVMRVINDEGSWAPALSNGEIHGGSPPQMNRDVVTQLQTTPGVQVQIGPGPSWEHLDFNLANPWFEDRELRRAIFTAIDVEDIASRTVGDVFPDYTLRTNHVFPSTSEHHVDHVTNTGQGSGDVDRALEILEAAGYELVDGVLSRDGETVGPFRLRSTATTLRATTMELVQSHLDQIGIEVTIETTDDLGAMLGSADYDIAQFGWSGSPFFSEVPSQQWHSESGSNFGGYSNSEVDELAEQAASATSLEEAAELANAATQLVVDDAYVLPIMDSPVYLYTSEDYVNVRDNTNTSLRGVHNNHQWGLAVQ